MISYLITDPKYYSNFSQLLTCKLKNIKEKHNFNFACLRDKENENYESLIRDFLTTCKTLHVKPILHNFLNLAIKYRSFGIHFSSNNYEKIQEAKKNNLFTIASAHSKQEADDAIFLGADLVTISPIFTSPNKAEPLGLVKLKEITDKIPNKCIALGGILDDLQVDDCMKANAVGFASIRYFLK